MLSLRPRLPASQRGVVLMVALIVLIAMTLAGLALVRSMDTANLIAGNMAFQQAAVHSGDAGIERAVAWLEANNAGTTLHGNIPAQGYVASRQDPAVGQSWDAFWINVLVPAGRVVPVLTDAGGNALADASGNTVWYTIQRLCNGLGDPVGVGVDCAVSPTAGTSAGSSKGAGVIALHHNAQIYYRITSRIAGPRNTVSYVQAIVAL
jgi:Tfp pilus assembly protein PilX